KNKNGAGNAGLFGKKNNKREEVEVVDYAALEARHHRGKGTNNAGANAGTNAATGGGKRKKNKNGA
ncbi:hypothetical protein BN1708_018008, partial [Verticillium longisporum]